MRRSCATRSSCCKQKAIDSFAALTKTAAEIGRTFGQFCATHLIKTVLPIHRRFRRLHRRLSRKTPCPVVGAA